MFCDSRHANDGPNINLVDLFKLVGTRLSVVCCFVIRGSTGFISPVFQWYCFTPRGSPSATIRFCRVLISDSSYAIFVICLYPMLIH